MIQNSGSVQVTAMSAVAENIAVSRVSRRRDEALRN
jgi:hypothetical protein